MRPGLTVDRDHIHRFRDYIYAIRSYVDASTGLSYKEVTGMLVADNLASDSVIRQHLKALEREGMYALTWSALLANAEKRWKDFLFAVERRTPRDPRLEDVIAQVKLDGDDVG